MRFPSESALHPSSTAAPGSGLRALGLFRERGDKGHPQGLGILRGRGRGFLSLVLSKKRQNPESGEITRTYFDDGFACHILAYNSEGVRVIDRSCDNKTPFVSIYTFLRMSFLSPYIAKDKNWHSMGVKLCLLLSDK